MSSSYLTSQQHPPSVSNFDHVFETEFQSERQKILELVPKKNDKDTSTTTNENRSRSIYQSPLRYHNLFNKRLHLFTSVSILVVAIFVLCLYVFTSAFGEHKRSSEDVCLNAEESFAGYEECKNVCRDYRCCFIAGLSSCMDSNKMSCMQFESCKILDNIASQSSKHFMYLTNVCAEDSLIGSKIKVDEYQDPFEECAIACADVECCFLEGDSSCRDGFEEYCDMYRPCLNMYKVMKEIEEGPGPVILDLGPSGSPEKLDDDEK